jgi:uncharacterized protein (TIGR02757 family)
MMKESEIKDVLDHEFNKYNRISFIDEDPISIPHQFTEKQDIEISGLLAATIAWGNRISIVKNANRLIGLMDLAPYDFVMNHSLSDLSRFKSFVHRTFNPIDLEFFILGLKNIYTKHESLENVFTHPDGIKMGIEKFRTAMFETIHKPRSEKHISSPLKGSAAKRLNMYLRWMVRTDKRGVDFGIWKKIKPSQLYIPLDIHTGNVGRQFGLLTRKQNDWKAVNELTNALKRFDSTDPIKYDFALFGIGVNA